MTLGLVTLQVETAGDPCFTQLSPTEPTMRGSFKEHTWHLTDCTPA